VTDFSTIAIVFGSLGTGSIALVGGISWVARRLHRFNDRFDEFMKDWDGADARPGVPHRPGVMERLSQQDDALRCINDRLVSVEVEVNPNSGKSMKDIVHRVDGNLKHIRDVVEDVNDRVTKLEGRGSQRAAR
jgi:hypothetical protein